MRLLRMLSRRKPLDDIQEIGDVSQFPHAVTKAGLHRMSATKRLMNSAKVVVHEVQCDRRFVVRHLLAELICHTRKPAHRHAHSEIGALNVACGNFGFTLDETAKKGGALFDTQPICGGPYA